MTKTETRLRDYLGAVADSVRPDNTRPLAPPDRTRRAAGAQDGHRGWPARDGRRGWPAWAPPLAAAASVLAVVSLAVALTGQVITHRASSSATGTAAALPRYYVASEGVPAQAVVRSVSSGAVIARVPDPSQRELLDVAAAPDDRTFYAAYIQPKGKRYSIYSFRVPGPGKITQLTRIWGGAAAGGGVLEEFPALAVSPDGEKLAFAMTTTDQVVPEPQHVANEIAVIDLRTGAQHIWQGGLNRPGNTVTIRSVSWAGHGRSLDFLATWCGNGHQGAACREFDVPATSTSQVRSLNLGTGGGSLDDSTVLISEPRFVEWMTADSAGDIDLLVLSGRKQASSDPQTVTISQYSAARGVPQRVLYRHDYDGYRLYLTASSLVADPSGQHLLLALVFVRGTGGQTYTSGYSTVGWIDHGSFHALNSHSNRTAQDGW